VSIGWGQKQSFKCDQAVINGQPLASEHWHRALSHLLRSEFEVRCKGLVSNHFNKSLVAGGEERRQAEVLLSVEDSELGARAFLHENWRGADFRRLKGLQAEPQLTPPPPKRSQAIWR